MEECILNIISQIDPSAFACAPRMHHGELTATFPSSVSPRVRNLIALKAQNWRASAPTPPRPYDAEVEWLSCNGGQWFDTGCSINGESALECDMRVMVDASSDRCICGIREGATFKGPNFFSGTIETSTQGFQRNISSAYSYGVPFNLVVNYGVGGRAQVIKDGTSLYDSGAGFVPGVCSFARNLYMFAINITGTASWKFSGRVWRYRITRGDGTDVLDYIPVRVGDVGMIYDRASGQLHGNQGTGAFGVGPDI